MSNQFTNKSEDRFGSWDTKSESSFDEGKISEYLTFLKELKETEIPELKKNFQKQPFVIIEIVGIFSAILAFTIINVSIIESVSTFLKAILLIVGLTCSLIIFLVVLHNLFSETKNSLAKIVSCWSVWILIILVVVGIVTSNLNINIFNLEEDKNNLSISHNLESEV